MKAIKSLLAVSALATVACNANAFVWDISMSENTYFAAALGPLIMNFNGTYDDAAPWVDRNGITRQGVADVAGRVEAPGFAITIDYSSIVFNMDFTTGVGYLNPPDLADCSSNNMSNCAAFSPALSANLYNDINSSKTAGAAFDPAPGVYTWTAVIPRVNWDDRVEIIELPFTVTLSSDNWTPPTTSVPEPNGIALLLAGLLGLSFTRYRGLRS